MQEALRQFSLIESSEVGKLLDRRSIKGLIAALQLVTTHDTTLVATVLSVAKDLQGKGPLMEVPARVKKALNLITTAIKNFQEDATAKDIFQLAVSNDVFREFADSTDYKPHGYNQIERFVLDKQRKQRGEREAKEVKTSVRPSEPKPTAAPSTPKKGSTTSKPSQPTTPSPASRAGKAKPDDWTPRADTPEKNKCPVCKKTGHYAEACPDRRADREARSKVITEKKEGSTAQLESPGYFVSAAISVPEGTRLQPVFVDMDRTGTSSTRVSWTTISTYSHAQHPAWFSKALANKNRHASWTYPSRSS